jgi:hypothetical protein
MKEPDYDIEDAFFQIGMALEATRDALSVMISGRKPTVDWNDVSEVAELLGWLSKWSKKGRVENAEGEIHQADLEFAGKLFLVSKGDPQFQEVDFAAIQEVLERVTVGIAENMAMPATTNELEKARECCSLILRSVRENEEELSK